MLPQKITNFTNACRFTPPTAFDNYFPNKLKGAVALRQSKNCEHRILESKLSCPQCGETMTPIGKEVTQKLKIIPARIVIVEDHYYSYAENKIFDTHHHPSV